MEDEPHSGRTCTSKTDENMTKVRAVVRYDRCLTVRMIGSELIWIPEPSTTFSPWNWACKIFVQSWFQNTSTTNKRKIEGMCAWTFLKHRKWQIFFFQTCHNRWWIMDFRVLSRNQTTKFGVAHEQLTAPKESKNEQIVNQIHANLFFRQSRCCSKGIRASRTNS